MGHIFWYGQGMSPSGLVKGMPPSDLVYALCNAPSWFGQPPCFWSKNASFWFGIIGMYPSDLIKQMPLFGLVKQMSIPVFGQEIPPSGLVKRKPPYVCFIVSVQMVITYCIVHLKLYSAAHSRTIFSIAQIIYLCLLMLEVIYEQSILSNYCIICSHVKYILYCDCLQGSRSK